MKRPLLKGSILVAILFLAAVLLPATTLAPVSPDWAPKPLRNWANDARLLIGRPLTTISSLTQAIGNETDLYWSKSGKTITFESGDLQILGTLYSPKVNDYEKNPGILLLHGSTPQGRKLGFYRILSQELTELGYIVLTIDFRGYGQSDDPPDVKQTDSFDYMADVANALAYLRQYPGVDATNISLIGHSFGGDVAMAAVSDEIEVTKLVIIGPGRRFIERGGSEKAPELEYFIRRDMRYMRLPEPIPTDVFLEYRATLTLENHLDYFADPGHVPVLFIDGELESEDDRLFLQNAFETMSAIKAYETLDDADHYANVANIGPLIIYDELAVIELVSVIDTFLKADVVQDP